jgi:hypothetical protein
MNGLKIHESEVNDIVNAAEVWGGASYNKYVSQIDKFVNRAYRNGYTSNGSDFKAIISNRDKKLWSRIMYRSIRNFTIPPGPTPGI